MDRGAWCTAVHSVTESQTRLSTRAHTHTCTHTHVHTHRQQEGAVVAAPVGFFPEHLLGAGTTTSQVQEQ